MMLRHSLSTFTQHDWEQVFTAFATANKSHWKVPPYDAVMSVLHIRSTFEFDVKNGKTWTCRLVLTSAPDGLRASFVPNEGLSAITRRHLEKMKEAFETDIRNI